MNVMKQDSRLLRQIQISFALRVVSVLAHVFL